jgi:hypothetical protein
VFDELLDAVDAAEDGEDELMEAVDAAESGRGSSP